MFYSVMHIFKQILFNPIFSVYISFSFFLFFFSYLFISSSSNPRFEACFYLMFSFLFSFPSTLAIFYDYRFLLLLRFPLSSSCHSISTFFFLQDNSFIERASFAISVTCKPACFPIIPENSCACSFELAFKTSSQGRSHCSEIGPAN